MAVSIVSFVCRKAAAGGVSNWMYRNQKRFASSLAESCFRGCPSLASSRVSPWLMLPPSSDSEKGDLQVYNFYSLAHNKVFSINDRSGEGADEIPSVVDKVDIVVGCSKGWLTMFNCDNYGMSLLNPLSRRHVKLPSFDTLPVHKSKMCYTHGCISTVLISCSPTENEQGCRALMLYAPTGELAFCCPGSTEWTPFNWGTGSSRYESVVYSTKQQVFFCIKDDDTLEALDLRDPQSPCLIPMELSFDDDNYPVVANKDGDIKYDGVFEKSLVINQQSDQLFVVNRCILERIDADGNFVEPAYFGSPDPYKTIAFDVHKYEQDKGWLQYMDCSLDGLALFIDRYDGFALSAADFPELKPNSIYFTDLYRDSPYLERHSSYGGHDLGIFNYEDASFSPCYYPCDVRSIKRIDPPPHWFTPTPL